MTGSQGSFGSSQLLGKMHVHVYTSHVHLHACKLHMHVHACTHTFTSHVFFLCSLIKNDVQRPNYDKLQVRLQGVVSMVYIHLFLFLQNYTFFTKYDSAVVDVVSWYMTVR